MPAGDSRFDGDSIAWLDVLDGTADLDDGTSRLVTEDDRTV